MNKKHVLLLSTIMLIIFSAIVGCSFSSAGDDRASEVTFVESWDFASGFHPINTLAVSTNHGPAAYMPNFYETLVNYKDGEFVPGLAESWDISADGQVYTFYLKENVKFSDGTRFDAEAVKKNLEVIPIMLGDYNGTMGRVTTLLDQIVVMDPYTVEVHLTSPYYGALKDFTMPNPMAMVSPNGLESDGAMSEEWKTTTFGTGPYMYEGETDGTTYTFIKNPYYWGEDPQVEKFHIKVIPDNDTKLLALRNGEIDMIVGAKHVSHDGFNEMKAVAGFEAIISEAVSSTRTLGFNVTKAPFDELDVRLAASYAIDKLGISSSIFSGVEPKADSIFDPSMPYTDVNLTPYEYDKEKAKELLENAGWVDSDGDGVREKNGVRLEGEILYMTGQAMIDDLILALATQLNEIGMAIKPNGMERMAYYSKIQQNEFTIAFNETYGIIYDPYTYISNMNPDHMMDNFAALGLSFVENSNEIINALNVSVDEEEIQETYSFILTEIHEKAIFLPISYMKELAVYNSAKIEEYTFYSYPSFIDVTAITLK
ncbi:ABC transporter substrate-binding protein [Caldalkalibacillus horti]|uniref:Nickel transport system substrate-binding protein n=1 Tax=Caldalkalibacillus horti TaxID=77523 RepID=A0ABT9W099_9BACI|nr:ABC transporter substrate-binding protein [Bacillus horti]MDQ0166520.1 nickel transport system substrate-binding protein [Bacillus horti]